MKLMTKAILAKLAPLYSDEGKEPDALAIVKFFMPDGNWTWYASEFDGEDTFYGLVSGFEAEFGFFTLSELEKIRGSLGLPVERDRYFKPTSLRDLQNMHSR